MSGKWTREEDEWLAAHYEKIDLKEISDRIKELFGTNRSPTAINQRGRLMGLQRKPKFTEEMDEWLTKTFLNYKSTMAHYKAYVEKFGDEAMSKTTFADRRLRYELSLVEKDRRLWNWIRSSLDDYDIGKEFYAAFSKRFHAGISPTSFGKLVRRAEKQVEKARDEEAERRAFHPVPYHMRHIKMHASDYRRTCCVCGRRVYQAETVIGKEGKERTYCLQCFKERRRIHAR